MEEIKVNIVFMSSFGGKVSFLVDRDVRVVAFVDEKEGNTSSCV